jgi:hypothetical protein
MPDAARVSRRQSLRLAALAGAAAAAGSLTGCRRGGAEGLLLTPRGQMPPAWLQHLPQPWQARPLPSPAAVLATATEPAAPTALLLNLGDGWAQQLDRSQLQPCPATALLAGLDARAAAASRLWGGQDTPAVAFPWAFGTWLLVLRDRPDLVARHRQGWALLLDPSLRRRLLLPASPRVVIDIASRQLGWRGGQGTGPDLEDPRLLPQLRRLRQQALAFDEVDALNLLLSGDAEAAVLPSHQVQPLLARDPRLQALLPESGSPLWWQLLLQPLPLSPLAAHPAWPLPWLADGLALPLLDRLLAGGWVPPLPRAQLVPALARWPERLRPLLLPPEAVLERCSDLVAFSPAEQRRWQQLWDQAFT